MSVRRAASTLWVVLLLAACAARDTAPLRDLQADPGVQNCGFSNVELRAQIDLPSDLSVSGVRLGGISGIDYSPGEDAWLLVSDAREADGFTHVFKGKLNTDNQDAYAFDIVSAINVTTFAEDEAVKPLADAEAIRAIPRNAGVYLTSEGDTENGIPAGILRRDANEPVARRIPINTGAMPGHPRTIRDNLSFEGLSVPPDGNGLWIGLEAPYREEGQLPTLEQGALVPIVHVSEEGMFLSEYRYPIEPIASQLPGRLADNGLSELLALDDERFLMLERSGAQQPDGTFRFTGRLFCAWVPDQAIELQKAPLVEINDLAPLDYANFEGMAFGPRLPDGRRSLFLISDNNFGVGIPTTILVLAVN